MNCLANIFQRLPHYEGRLVPQKWEPIHVQPDDNNKIFNKKKMFYFTPKIVALIIKVQIGNVESTK